MNIAGRCDLENQPVFANPAAMPGFGLFEQLRHRGTRVARPDWLLKIPDGSSSMILTRHSGNLPIQLAGAILFGNYVICHGELMIQPILMLLAVCSLAANALAQDDSLTKGKAVIRKVEHGSFVQYVPKSVKPNSKLLVVCHGMFSSGTALQSAQTCLKHWHKFAEEAKVIAVAPAFDNANYACTKPGAFGGYRTLTGRVVGADDFLHEIVDVYQEANPKYDGRFLLFGHSAGAQFANRYVVRYPDRVIGALISSPAWFAFPDEKERWPYGMAPRKTTFTWEGTKEKIEFDVAPDKQWWVKASQLPLTVIVGEEDTKPLKKGMQKNHVTQATDWVNAMNEVATQNELKGKVRLMVVKDVGHNYGKLSRAGAKSLRRALRTNR